MLKGKKVLVLGLAKSGLAATRLLVHLHASVTVNEYQPLEKISCLEELKSLGVEIIAGGHPDELFERDFDFVIKNPGIKYHMPFILRLQERRIPIYTEIELAYQVSKKQHYIAITGTNGKTTTTTLVYEIMKKQYENTYVAGNIGTPLCDLVLQEDLLHKEDNYIILEMSNFQLLNIDAFRPEVSTIINLTPDHLDYMASVEEYYASKTNIYQRCKDDDLFLLNTDDPTVLEYTSLYPIPCRIQSFSYMKEADIDIKDNHVCVDGEEIFDLDDLKLVGKHNVQNVLVAIGIALRMDVPKEVIADTIKSFNGVEHRIEFVREINGAKYYNDSKATNTDATIIAIQAFHDPLILLLGGFDKGLDMHELNEYSKNSKINICFGAAGKRFVEEIDNAIYCSNLAEATKKAYELASPGDVVLLSPSTSSYDEFTGYEQRGRVFKELVQAL